MKQKIFSTTLLAVIFSSTLAAQQVVPQGTTIPVTLTSSLTSNSAEGQVFSARVMQSVMIGPDLAVPTGARLVGHVVESRPAGEGGPLLSFRFDRVLANNGELHATFAVRAIASSLELHDAKVPKTGPDEGTSAYSWTTVLVGGDVAYGRGEPLMAGTTEVGCFGSEGATSRLASATGSDCELGLQPASRMQSLWLFSSAACGVYGLDTVTIQHSGRTMPAGDIVLRASGKALNLRSGTGLLLEVVRNTQP